MKKTLSFILIFWLVSMQILTSQNFEPINIPFEVDGELKKNALIGGLIAPQFLAFDLDGQGAEDMIVFDRNGDVLLPFINNSTPGNPDYLYAPEFTKFFPELLNFVQFHDFNGDGKKDIFSLAPAGSAIQIHRNTSTEDGLSFELMKFNFGLGDFLQFPIGGGYSQVYVSAIDIPAIIDVDNDGDIDVLTFEPGGSYMYYYRNMTKEMGLQDDTLVYVLEDACWGKFFESGVGEEISLSDNSNNCASGLKDEKDNSGERHSGSTVLALDGDGDGDLDMLLGDLSNNGFVYLENGGTSSNAFMIDQNTKFPTGADEVNISVHIAPYYIDIDNDGKRDLVAAQNNKNGAQNINHIWYYKNVGEDNSPVFELVEKDFLHNTSLVMGSGSYPTFLDFNADGLQDILVGTHRRIVDGSSDTETKSLYLYENVGTKTTPSYRLETNDYLGMRDIVTTFDGYLAPTLGDLDNDGDDDIIVADKSGSLYYWENTSGPNQPYEFTNYIYEYKEVDPGSNCKPAIRDLDNDGLNDLIIGEKNENTNAETGVFGGINFFKNIGEIGNPEFNPDVEALGNTNTLGNVFTKTINQTSGASSPSFFESNDELFLSVGSKSGDIFIYNEIEGNLYDSFNIVYVELPILNCGIRTTAVYADLDDDGYLEVIVGNDNGGLRAFNTTFVANDSSSNSNTDLVEFYLSPNPATEMLDVNFADSIDAEFKIFDVTGSLMMKGVFKAEKTTLEIDVLPQGVYIIDVRSDGKSGSKRFVKL